MMPKSKSKKKNIFCLEGDWNENLKIKSSILPALKLLEINNNIDTIYRTCSTFEEFCNRLDTITGNRKIYKNYDIIYFAFHGLKNQIQIGCELITLETISEHFEGKFEGKIIHFGSCKTMAINDEKAKLFMERTGAIAISGYEKTVPFISSTIADVVYFEICQNYIDIKAINDNMKRHYGDLVAELKFKMYY
jgi:hypothetical protein